MRASINRIVQSGLLVCIVQILLVGCHEMPTKTKINLEKNKGDVLITIYWCGAVTKPVPEVAFGTQSRVDVLELWKRARPSDREFVSIEADVARCMLDKTFNSDKFQIGSTPPNAGIQGYVMSVATTEGVLYDQLGISPRGLDAIKIYKLCIGSGQVASLQRVINTYDRLCHPGETRD
jgi:hypothetical protein